MVSGGSFRAYIWDPLLIISQIIAMQSFYYVSLCLILTFLFQLSTHHPEMHHVLDPTYINLSNLENTLVVIANIVNSLAVSVFLWIIVQRSKLCLDFTCTLHLFQMLIGWMNSGKLFTFSSLIIQIICISISSIAGEFLCMRSEMKAIPLIGGSRIDL